jgi:hypothetical protein
MTLSHTLTAVVQHTIKRNNNKFRVIIGRSCFFFFFYQFKRCQSTAVTAVNPFGGLIVLTNHCHLLSSTIVWKTLELHFFFFIIITFISSRSTALLPSRSTHRTAPYHYRPNSCVLFAELPINNNSVVIIVKNRKSCDHDDGCWPSCTRSRPDICTIIGPYNTCTRAVVVSRNALYIRRLQPRLRRGVRFSRASSPRCGGDRTDTPCDARGSLALLFCTRFYRASDRTPVDRTPPLRAYRTTHCADVVKILNNNNNNDNNARTSDISLPSSSSSSSGFVIFIAGVVHITFNTICY